MRLLLVASASARSRIGQNAIALYAAFLANVIIPLATAPYLARVLHPSGFGLVVFAQALALYGALVIDYGFNLSATRDVAQRRDDPAGLSRLFASVLGARAALSLLVVAGACLARWLVPTFRAHPEMVWLGVFWAVAQGSRPYWYFQGLEQLKFVAALDVGAKVLAAFGVFVLVKQPDDGWIVIALQGAAASASTLVAFGVAYRSIAVTRPRVVDCWNVLRSSSAAFFLRGALSLYSLGNVFILGLMAPASAVGLYAGAERVVRTTAGTFEPVFQALFPRSSRLAVTSRSDAARYTRLVFALTGLAGVVMGLVILASAPMVIPFVLGAEFQASVSTTRILALLPLEIGLSSALGYHWMLPLRMERTLIRVALLTGSVNILGAVLLVPRFEQNGMAVALVFAEMFAIAAIMLTLHRRRLNPIFAARLAAQPAVQGGSD